MSDRPGLWFPLVLLAALAALTTWLDFEVRSAMTEAALRDRHDPDTVLHNFVTQQTARSGAVETTVRARTMRRFMDDGSSEFEQPQIERRDAKGVVMLETTYLKVLPQNNRASTDRPVRFSSANTLVTGLGLDFDMNARTVKIRSRVKVVYNPPRSHATSSPRPLPERSSRRPAARRPA